MKLDKKVWLILGVILIIVIVMMSWLTTKPSHYENNPSGDTGVTKYSFCVINPKIDSGDANQAVDLVAILNKIKENNVSGLKGVTASEAEEMLYSQEILSTEHSVAIADNENEYTEIWLVKNLRSEDNSILLALAERANEFTPAQESSNIIIKQESNIAILIISNVASEIEKTIDTEILNASNKNTVINVSGEGTISEIKTTKENVNIEVKVSGEKISKVEIFAVDSDISVENLVEAKYDENTNIYAAELKLEEISVDKKDYKISGIITDENGNKKYEEFSSVVYSPTGILNASAFKDDKGKVTVNINALDKGEVLVTTTNQQPALDNANWKAYKANEKYEVEGTTEETEKVYVWYKANNEIALTSTGNDGIAVASIGDGKNVLSTYEPGAYSVGFGHSGYIDTEDVLQIVFKNTQTAPTGTLVETWDASINGDGSVTAWLMKNSTNTSKYDLYIGANGKIILTTGNRLFSSYIYCTSITGLGNLDTSNVTDMSHMFRECDSLTTLNFSGWDTSKVTNMDSMFWGCSRINNLNLSYFDTSLVTDMSSMFWCCGWLTNLNTSGWDTGNVLEMQNMFDETGFTSLDLSGFDTSKVTNMSKMFYLCEDLTSLNISSFNTSNVTDMSYMFDGCKKVTSLAVNGFTTSKVTNMSNMFFRCELLTSINVTNFNTTKVTTMSNMFSRCAALTSLDLTSFNTEALTGTAYNMFSECTNLESIILGKNFTKIHSSMFASDTSLQAIIAHRTTPMTFTKNTGDSISATLYVPSSAEAAYESATNYSSVFGADRIKPILELIGDDEVTVRIGGSYTEEGVNFLGYTTSSSNTRYKHTLTPSGTNVSTSSIGEYTVTYTAKYNGTTVDTVSRTVNVIDKSENTLSISGRNLEYDGSAQVLVSAYSSKGTLYYSLETELTSTNYSTAGSPTKPTGTNVGTYTIYYYTPGNTDYKPASGSVTSTIRKGTNTLEVTGLELEYNGRAQTLVSSILAKGDVYYAVGTQLTSSNYSSKGSTTKPSRTNVGTYTVYYYATGNDNYNSKSGSVTAKILQKQAVLMEETNCSVSTSDERYIFLNEEITQRKKDVATITIKNTSGAPRNTETEIAKWDVSAVGSEGSVYAWLYTNAEDTAMCDLYICADGIITASNGAHLLSYYTNCTSIKGLEYLDTSSVPDMSRMFAGCMALTDLDVSGLDTSSVTDMSNMFYYCENLTKLDLKSFNTTNVTNMSLMFDFCGKLAELDVSSFNTINVNDMASMFGHCYALTTLNIINFNTSNVTDMGWMFFGSSALTTLDVTKFDTSKVTDMSRMFESCSALTSIDVSKFDTSNVTDMSHMFSQCTGLTSLDITKFVTINVKNMSGLFNHCSGLTTLDVTKLNTSNATNMADMFAGCTKLTSIDLSNFVTNKVTNMSYMFQGCSGLTSLNITNFDTSKVKNMHCMFSGCSNLTSLDLRNLDTTALDGSYSWSTTYAMANQYAMFNSCSRLKTIIIGEKFDKLEGANMFYNCTQLRAIITTKAITSSGEAMSLTGTENVTNSSGKIIAGPTKLADLPNAILYVPNTTAEAAYETATNYSTVFGADRIKPILELVGDNPVEVKSGTTYTDAGATVTGFNTANATNYTQYGYTLSGPVLKNASGTTVSNLENSNVGETYTATYTLIDKSAAEVMSVTREITVSNALVSLTETKSGVTTTTNFETLHEAVSAASLSTAIDAGTYSEIKILENLELTENAIANSKNIRVDLNGKILTRDERANTADTSTVMGIKVSSGTLTMIDSSTGKTGKMTILATNRSTHCLYGESNANIIIEGGTYETAGESWVIPVKIASGIVELKDGIITASASKGSLYGVEIGTAAGMKMSGGTIDVSYTGTSTVRGIQNWNNAEGNELVISGGTINVNSTTVGTIGIYVANNNGITKVTGGTIKAEATTGTSRGIYVNATEQVLTIGTKGGEISTTQPHIQGTTYGVQSSSKIKFYDGCLNGQTAAYSTEFAELEPGKSINIRSKTIDTKTYKSAYLSLGRLMQRAEETYVIGAYRAGKTEYTADKIKTITIIDLSTTAAPATFADSWDVSEIVDSSKKAWLVVSEEDPTMYDLYIGAYGNILAPVNSSFLFANYTKCTKINNLHLLDFSSTTNMQAIFYQGNNLVSLDVSSWKTGNVTNLWDAFNGCSTLTELDLSKWNVSNVKYFVYTFCGCTNLETLNITGWITSSAKQIDGFVRECTALTTLDVASFDTSNVVSMATAFYKCSNLTTIDVSEWVTTNVQDMSWMFGYCNDLETIDVSKWNTANVTKLYNIFYACNTVKTLDVTNWKVDKVTSLEAVFYGCNNITALNLSSWNTENVEDMSKMFNECTNLTEVDVSNFKTSKVKDMNAMFRSCENLKTINVTGFDTSSVLSMGVMFSGCKSLTYLDLSSFDTSSLDGTTYDFVWADKTGATDVAGLLNGCTNLKTVLLGKDFGTLNSRYEFYSANSLTSIITQNTTPMPLSTTTGISSSTILYVPNTTAETAYEAADNYAAVFSSGERVRPILELVGDNPTKAALGVTYTDAGATVAGFNTANATNYTQYGYEVSGPVIKDEKGNVVNSVDTSDYTSYTLTYTLKYAKPVASGETANTPTEVMSVTRTVNVTGENYSVNGVFYPTLAKAYEAITGEEGTIIVENTDFIDSSKLNIAAGKDITIDTNGKTIIRTSNAINNNGTLTIEGNGTITTQNRADNTLTRIIENMGTLNIDGPTLINNGLSNKESHWYIVFVGDNATNSVVNLYNGSLQTPYSEVRPMEGYSARTVQVNGGIFNMYSGEIIAGEGRSIESWNAQGNAIKIYGGLLKSDKNNNISLGWSSGANTTTTLEIHGGSFEAKNYVVSTSEGYVGNITILGGTLKGHSNGINALCTGTLTIGNNADSVSNASPVIIGGANGVKATNGFNFYDGILKGTKAAYSGEAEIIDGYGIYHDTEVISGETYKTAALRPYLIERDIKLETYVEGTTVEDYQFLDTDVNKLNSFYALGAYKFGETNYTADKIVSIKIIDTTKTAAPTTYAKSWDVSKAQDGRIKVWLVETSAGSDKYNMIIGSDGVIMAPETSYSLFRHYVNATEISGLALLDTTYAENMVSMLQDAKLVTTLDVGNWNVSNVSNMALLFANNINLQTLDVSNWDTSKNTSISCTFSKCINLEMLDVSNWNTSNIKDMTYAFGENQKLTTLDVSNWNTSQATNMEGVFSGCTKVSKLEISNWDTANVLNMSWMFSNCGSLTGLNANALETGKVTNMSGMFFGCSGLTALNLSNIDTKNVTDMTSMFQECKAIKQLNISNFNTEKVKEMDQMFRNCESLISLDLSSFNTQLVEDMSYMFFNAKKLENLNLTSFNTSNVKDMNHMFVECKGLTVLDLSSFTISEDTNLDAMFHGASNLKSILLGENFSRINGKEMFKYTTFLKAIIAQRPTAMPLSTDTGIEASTVLYVANPTVEKVYESAENYEAVFGAKDASGDIARIKPILELIGDNPVYVAKSSSYMEEGVKVAGFENSNSGEYEQYGYTLVKPVITKDGATVTSVDASNIGTYKITYTLMYAQPVRAGETANVPTEVMTVVRTVNIVESILMAEDPTIVVLDKYILGNSTTVARREDVLTINIQDDLNVPSGTLEAEWDVSKNKDRTVIAWLIVDETDTTKYHLYIGGYGKVIASSGNHLFYGYTNCTLINGLDKLDTTGVTTMLGMFCESSSLTKLDVTKFNTSSVTNMQSMFRNCKKLEELDVSHFDTQNVENMLSMFFNCSSLTKLDVSKFVTVKVTTMREMFLNCSSLTELNVSGFNTSEVTTMYAMFQDCSRLTSLDVSKFNVVKVETMQKMFRGCSSLTELDISKFDTSNVKDFAYMFLDCSKLKTLNVSEWNLSKAESIGGIFHGCSGLTSLDVSKWNTSNVYDMYEVFANCSSLTEIDVSKWNTSSATTMATMFRGCSSLTELNVSNFVTTNVTDMEYMFKNSTALKTILLGKDFDKLNGTDMFANTPALRKVISHSPTPLELGRDININDSMILYVVDETGCEADPVYEDVFGTKDGTGDIARVEPIAEPVGRNPYKIAIGEVYSDEGATVVDITEANSGEYKALGYSLTTIGLPIDTSTDGTKYVTYVLTYARPLTSGEIAAGKTQDAPVEIMRVVREVIVVEKAIIMERDYIVKSTTETDIFKASDTQLIGGGYLTDYYVIGAVRENKLEYTADKVKTITIRNDLTVPQGTILENWDISEEVDGNVQLWIVQNGDGYDLHIGGFMDITVNNARALLGYYPNCTAISGLGNLDLNPVVDMSCMFAKNKKLQTLDVTSFDTSSAKTTEAMFYMCESLNTLDLSDWDTTNLVDMSNMFEFCKNLKTIDLTTFETQNVQNMGALFGTCTSLESVDLSSFVTSNVTDMSYMFSYCTALNRINLSKFDTSKVSTMYQMFNNCENLTELNLSTFDTANVMEMGEMFNGCEALQSVKLTNFTTSKVATMDGMFRNCKSLVELDLSTFNTRSVTNMNEMFKDTGSMEILVLGNGVDRLVGKNMFTGCSKLTTIIAEKSAASEAEAIKLGDATGLDILQTIMYVPNIDSETNYEKAENYINVFGIDRIKPILELVGEEKIEIFVEESFTEEGVTIAGISNINSSRYTNFGYTLNGPVVTLDGTAVDDVDVMNVGTYLVRYTLKNDGTTVMIVTRTVVVMPLEASLTVSQTEVELVAGNSHDITYEYVGDGTVNIKVLDKNIADISAVGTTLTITGLAEGETDINLEGKGVKYTDVSAEVKVKVLKANYRLISSGDIIYYNKLQDAIDNSISGDSIVVLEDVNEIGTKLIDNDITIDLGNHKITTDGSIRIETNTTVTIIGEASGEIENVIGTAIENAGVLVLGKSDTEILSGPVINGKELGIETLNGAVTRFENGTIVGEINPPYTGNLSLNKGYYASTEKVGDSYHTTRKADSTPPIVSAKELPRMSLTKDAEVKLTVFVKDEESGVNIESFTANDLRFEVNGQVVVPGIINLAHIGRNESGEEEFEVIFRSVGTDGELTIKMEAERVFNNAQLGNEAVVLSEDKILVDYAGPNLDNAVFELVKPENGITNDGKYEARLYGVYDYTGIVSYEWQLKNENSFMWQDLLRVETNGDSSFYAGELTEEGTYYLRVKITDVSDNSSYTKNLEIKYEKLNLYDAKPTISFEQNVIDNGVAVEIIATVKSTTSIVSAKVNGTEVPCSPEVIEGKWQIRTPIIYRAFANTLYKFTVVDTLGNVAEATYNVTSIGNKLPKVEYNVVDATVYNKAKIVFTSDEEIRIKDLLPAGYTSERADSNIQYRKEIVVIVPETEKVIDQNFTFVDQVGKEIVVHVYHDVEAINRNIRTIKNVAAHLKLVNVYGQDITLSRAENLVSRMKIAKDVDNGELFNYYGIESAKLDVKVSSFKDISAVTTLGSASVIQGIGEDGKIGEIQKGNVPIITDAERGIGESTNNNFTGVYRRESSIVSVGGATGGKSFHVTIINR